MFSEVTRPTDNTLSVSISVSQGSRMVVRSTFVFDHLSKAMDTFFRVSKNAENFVGRQYVCSAIAHAYKLSLSRGQGGPLILKGYRVNSTEVKGKPENSRVGYATDFAEALQQAHNNEMMRRHMLMNLFVAAAVPLPSPTPSPSPSPPPSPPSPPPSPPQAVSFPSYMFAHRPMPPNIPMPITVTLDHIRGFGMMTSPLLVPEGSQECSLCMEEPESKILYQVTCCIGKTICLECMGKLTEFARAYTNPVCPWCRS